MIFTSDIQNDPDAQARVIKVAEELESGNYKQGKGWLKRTRSGELTWCCLGVACDISGLGEWHERKLYDGASGWDYKTHTEPSTGYCDTSHPYHGSDLCLPTIVQKSLCLKTWGGKGIPSTEVKVQGTPNPKEWDLAGLNDAGVPFTEIARILREQLEQALR